MTTFTHYTPESAKPEAQVLLNNIQSGYGFIPNLFAYMAEAPVTIEAYLALNELIAKSSLTPAQAQTALLTVSLENNCDFCATAHRAIGKKSGINPQTVESLLNNQPIKDAKDDALVTLTRAIVRERGWLADEQIDAFIDSGFTKQQVFEVILVVTIKTLSNYSNHLTKPEVNPELLGML
jgi:AhpD family alkylhydroperoxidase